MTDIATFDKTLSEEETSIWRYMDLPRFVSLLATGTLWFAKAKLHEDPFEGFGRVHRRDVPPPDNGPRIVKHINEDGEKQISFAEMAADIANYAAKECESAADRLYVNCWCQGKESMAMWEIYGSHGHGIAVKSSIARFKRALKKDVRDEQYLFGAVQYHDDLASAPEVVRDFRTGHIPLSAALWGVVLELGLHKQACYAYENEWRALLYQPPLTEPGLNVGVDVNELIVAVHVGPRAAGYVKDAVEAIMEKFLVAKLCEQSALLSRE